METNVNAITRNYLDSILITEKLIGSTTASLRTEIFGREFASPVMMPAFSHLPAYAPDRESGLVEYAKAAGEMGLLNWIGMCENEAYGAIADTGVPTVRIVKPYADRDKILSQLDYACERGAFAVGIDIDHVFGSDGEYDVVVGERMACQTAEDIAGYVERVNVPFVIKGVLGAEDAKACRDCGVRGIVVSHHSGRMPFAVPPLSVLEEIRESAGRDMAVFVDCGIATGADAYKALALGADAVSVGRAMLPALKEKGSAGVREYVEKMDRELKMIMSFTGCAGVKQISRGMLRFTQKIERI